MNNVISVEPPPSTVSSSDTQDVSIRKFPRVDFEVLGHLRDKLLSLPQEIIRMVALAFGLEPSELMKKGGKTLRVVWARQVAAYLMRKTRRFSFADIAKAFDYDDRGGWARHSYMEVTRRSESDAEVREDLLELLNFCSSLFYSDENHSYPISPSLYNKYPRVNFKLLTHLKNRHVSTPQDIIRMVASAYDIALALIMKDGGRERRIVWARQVAAYLMRKTRRFSFADIADALGYEDDHSAALHCWNKVSNEVRKDPCIKEDVEGLFRFCA